LETTGGDRIRDATFGMQNWKRTNHGRKPRNPLLRKASGTLANRTLKLSKVLVTNSGDRASEAIGEIQNFRVPKVPTARRMILNFGDESATCLSRNVVSGGPQLVVELPMTVQLPGGVTVTVLRDNLCCNERLGGKASAWKPRAETEPGLQPSGSKTGNGPTTDGNRATKLFGIS
jgi:hypothetical protein